MILYSLLIRSGMVSYINIFAYKIITIYLYLSYAFNDCLNEANITPETPTTLSYIIKQLQNYQKQNPVSNEESEDVRVWIATLVNEVSE